MIGRFDFKPTRNSRVIQLPNGGVAIGAATPSHWDRFLNLFRRKWSPFDKRGNQRDLASEGWVRLGAMQDNPNT